MTKKVVYIATLAALLVAVVAGFVAYSIATSMNTTPTQAKNLALLIALGILGEYGLTMFGLYLGFRVRRR